MSKQIDSQATSRVSALLGSLGGISVGEDKAFKHTAAWYQMQVRKIQNTESSEQNLDEIKENIEQKAQEATAPKDVNGNPIVGLPSESSIGEVASTPEMPVASPETENSSVNTAPEVSYNTINPFH